MLLPSLIRWQKTTTKGGKLSQHFGSHQMGGPGMEESKSKKCLWRADILMMICQVLCPVELKMTHFVISMKKESTESNQSSNAT